LNTEITPKKLIGIVCAGAIASTTMGCASTGRLALDEELTKTFEQGKAKTDHSYFYAGDKDSPSAVIGINENYKINKGFWHPIDSQSPEYKKAIENMGKEIFSSSPCGYDIMSPDKKESPEFDIGDWYSTTNKTIIKQKDPTTFIIYTPSTSSESGGDGGSGSGGGSGGSGGGGGGQGGSEG
jgi:uncharacterized membrane protein YgcG